MPRSSPTNEHHPSEREMPFKTYSEYDKSVAHGLQSNSNYAHINGLDSNNSPNIGGDNRSRLHMTSTPMTSSVMVGSTAAPPTNGLTKSLSAHSRLYPQNSLGTDYSPIEQISNQQLRHTGKEPNRDSYRQQNRSSFYGASYQVSDDQLTTLLLQRCLSEHERITPLFVFRRIHHKIQTTWHRYLRT